MTAARLPMRQIREVLRLHFSSGLSQHAIARSLGMSQGAVSKYLAAARRAGLTWPLPPELDDDIKLEALLFPPPPTLPANSRPLPDWASLHRDLRRPGVTLNLLWEEYRANAPDGVGYSWFCDLYRAWTGRVTLVMRQVHIAGEKLFVDYSGHTMEVVDGLTGEVIDEGSDLHRHQPVVRIDGIYRARWRLPSLKHASWFRRGRARRRIRMTVRMRPSMF